MVNDNLPSAEASRTRKLDDLFGDEPFLSPTMKARRLHESGAVASSSGASAGNNDKRNRAYGLIPEISDDEATALWRRREAAGTGNASRDIPGGSFSDIEITSGDDTDIETVRLQIVDTTAPSAVMMKPHYDGDSSPSVSLIRFAEAAAHLRADCPSGSGDGLETMRRFRHDVLARWIKSVPARDIDGVEEN